MKQSTKQSPKQTIEKLKTKESDEQKALIQWANLQANCYSELDLLFAIPNGGSRNLIEAVNLKRQGVKSGVPDLCLPVARCEKHGLYIELKVEKGKISENQNWWLERLARQGYATKVCYGWKDAAETIMWYLGITKVIEL